MLPITVDVAGKRVLVVGGGAVATRRVQVLIRQRADVVVVAPQLSEELVGWVSAGEISWLARGFEARDIEGAWLVLAFTGVPAVQDAVEDACAQAHTWCLVGGKPQASSFWFMAHRLVEGVTVAVSAGGRPRLAKQLVGDLAQYAQGKIASLKSSTR